MVVVAYLCFYGVMNTLGFRSKVRGVLLKTRVGLNWYVLVLKTN